ncbi:protein trachealess-like isoform X2 [Chironomus tepperi]|uniref:protein trachealess-like isoform X2 n=1 Tax=Chironomus tepperi TaxID=113505 RepID=UPI00391FA3EA
MDHNSGNYSSPWAAVLGHHHSMTSDPNFTHGLPMDLHVSQGFSYYRYREQMEPFCWNDRKPVIDAQASAVNSRILELRKEKSRDAARSRRGKENYEFYELAKMLPLPGAITSQLDKASIIRLTMSYLKLRDFTSHGDPPWNRENKTMSKIFKSNSASRRTTAGLALELFEQHQGTHILQSLDGFTLALAADGRFLYISETVSIYLGLSQVEMTGSSIFDYIHQGDHSEIAEQLGLSLTSQSSNNSGMTSPSSNTEEPTVSSQMSLNGSNYKGYERAFCVRMKSTLTKRGCHFKSSGYRVVLLLCHLRPQHSFSHMKKSHPPLIGMVAIAVALPPPSVHEIRLECDMFVTRINFDFRIVHCEPKITELLDYSPDELVGESLYTLCHGEDAAKLRKCHMDLINKGQVLTHYYRIMNRNGGYTWIQTCATVVCSAKNADEQNIICVNYIITGKENANMILDQCQLGVIKREPIVYAKNDNEPKSPDGDNSRNPHDHKNNNNIKQNSNENPTMIRSMSDNSSNNCVNKVNERAVQNCDDDASNSTSVKRGRKRKVKTEVKDDLPPPETTPPISMSHNESDITVKELENVMSKHLPKSMIHDGTSSTDFSTDSLLRHHGDVSDKNQATQFSHGNSHFAHQPTAPMPATALLRQLYANRESVIRATSRPANYMYSDNSQQQQSLPTPPNDSYDSQYLRKSSDAFGNLVSSYGAYSSMDYNNAMTPPSSVSPRDLTSHKSSGNYEYTNLSAGDARVQYQSGPNDTNSLPHLPLKPQPYAIHQMDHSSYGIDHQSQYFPYHSGFHLYHKNIYTPP